ncbi:MAG TPA: TauD/TfdA family dioxygenase [Streptosporangiaceae bacterium]|nr:TauD/TfdA family dioxygenase [Streptosporangiaceae bacterium]
MNVTVREEGILLLERAVVEPDAAIAALLTSMGYVDPLGNGSPPKLVFDVAAKANAADGSYSGQGTYIGSGESLPHTDSSNFPMPHAHVALACVRAQRGSGGESMIVSAASIAETLAKNEQAKYLELLAEPIYPFMSGWRSSDEVVFAPVLWRDADRWATRYAPQLVTEGAGLHPIDAEHSAALAEFSQLTASPDLITEFMMEPGDVLIIDNRRWLHGRREFDPESKRLLKRCKIYPLTATTERQGLDHRSDTATCSNRQVIRSAIDSARSP